MSDAVERANEEWRRVKRNRVWYHPPTDRLGYVVFDQVWGPIWFFADHRDDKILSTRFCVFVDDRHNPRTIASKEFVDLGVM